MGTVIIKMKLMPKSPEENIENLQKETEEILNRKNIKNFKFEIQPIAFGLKALIVLFGWPEEEELNTLEESIQKISGVGSLEILDMRRAIG
ncbi:elongation factor 1-beta [Candidatus Pacearchaeota archaeon]|nr:elongation factor 1-beta [Candidatus Pacearchaeota archaeon]